MWITRSITLALVLVAAVGAGAATFNVTSYGAVPGDGIDDGAAIINAAAALQTAGHGVLYFPSGVYNVYTTGTTYTSLTAFIGRNGVHVLCDGCTLAIDPTRNFTASYATMFYFDDCTNIRVDGFRVTGPVMDITQTTVKGVEFVRLNGATVNADLPMNRVQGVLGGLIVSGYPDTARNIHVGLLEVTQAWYGINMQNLGDNVTVDTLRTDTVHRSYFVYGVRNHKVRVESKDAYAIDVPMSSTNSRPFLEDIDLTYISRDTTASHDGGARIQLAFGGTTAQRIRNIRIRYDLTYSETGHNGAEALQIRKSNDSGGADTIDRGHLLDGLEISGYIGGSPDYWPPGLLSTYFACAWGTGDTWRNIAFRDLFLDSSVESEMDFGSLQGPLLLENVVSNASLGFHAPGSVAAPSTGTMAVINSKFPNQHAATSNWLALVTIASSVNLTIPTGWSTGKTITNSGAVSDIALGLPAATAGMEIQFTNVSSTWKIVVDPSGTEVIRGGGAGKYAAVPAGGTLRLRSTVSGAWEIVGSHGTITFEP